MNQYIVMNLLGFSVIHLLS